ncbi:hypothetical protein SAMN04487990_108143 [Bizionia paragorgiae]|uniref:Uncharacterized protein n=1 Tax=Bizionia paragorgiae TaxID=283786 RepID=A0A1H3ZGY1_BIZPA|nr:hypothetical protein SAMN04487990_108143 [Bizionia paragorgiae]
MDLGFVLGTQLQSHKEYHITENRKKMMSLRYTSLEKIKNEVLIDILNEARTLVLKELKQTKM